MLYRDRLDVIDCFRTRILLLPACAMRYTSCVMSTQVPCQHMCQVNTSVKSTHVDCMCHAIHYMCQKYLCQTCMGTSAGVGGRKDVFW